MKKLILSLAIIGFAGSVVAADLTVQRTELGSGQENTVGVEDAQNWDGVGDIYHAPQYMPGYPTAATLWARVIDLPCTKVGEVLNCDGYNWLPELGRGEYLMVRPVIKAAPVVAAPTKVYVEVPRKKKGE